MSTHFNKRGVIALTLEVYILHYPRRNKSETLCLTGTDVDEFDIRSRKESKPKRFRELVKLMGTTHNCEDLCQKGLHLNNKTKLPKNQKWLQKQTLFQPTPLKGAYVNREQKPTT